MFAASHSSNAVRLAVCSGIGLLSLFCALPVMAQQELIQNGGFEANGGEGVAGFTNWTVVDQSSSSGSWLAQTGTSTFISATTVNAPPQGSSAAMTDSEGPGSHVLYQDFVVPAHVTQGILSFQVYMNNQATGYSTPSSLDFTVTPNQQARVDLLTGASNPFSVAGGDVLLNAFQTQSGDPLVFGYNLISLDITTLLQAQSGNTLRLRFAEVDNRFLQNFGVDAASIQVTGTTTPEPGTLALLASFGITSVGLLRKRRLRSSPFTL